MNYYERHLGDYARDTGHLTPLEHGVYNLLLDRYYATEKPIPADQAQRICRARSKEEREAVEAVLGEFFSLEDGTYKHARVEGEIEKARARIDSARSNGKRGGRPKKNPTGSESETQKEPIGLSLGLCGKTGSKALQTPDSRLQTPEDQTLLPSASPKAPPADLAKHKAERLAQVTDDAIAAFNDSPLVKRQGGSLASVSATVGREKRQGQIRRCLRTVRAICQENYGSAVITPEFWPDYWAEVAADDFHAGRLPGGRGHENWKPDFEFLTREDVMLKVYDRAAAEDAA